MDEIVILIDVEKLAEKKAKDIIREKNRIHTTNYRKNHKDKFNEYMNKKNREYYHNNEEFRQYINQKNREYYQKNKEIISQKRRLKLKEQSSM